MNQRLESLPRGRDGAQGTARALTPTGITPARAGRRCASAHQCSATRNHSRAGGTETDTRPVTVPDLESLPRGRDGALDGRRRLRLLGITPARAGRSRRSGRQAERQWNHSRAGGTESVRATTATPSSESLPRGRDGVPACPRQRREQGITPARAGRRPPRRAGMARPRNHSRAGGTEPTPRSGSTAATESLPRGRDGAHRPRGRDDARGITPARAGRRRSRTRRGWCARNHSRAGGTELYGGGGGGGAAESLPRGRDGAMTWPCAVLAFGITPARAGRRSDRRQRPRRGRNHSRAGGTEEHLRMDAATGTESLPRGRDGAGSAVRARPCRGITPARAGRSSDRGPLGSAVGNHSRAGGTESMSSSASASMLESLPRGRDGDPIADSDPGEGGITPARAGRRSTYEWTPRPARNHSRAGGTEQGQRYARVHVEESLPRGRDGVPTVARWVRLSGITPARAGRSP